MELVNLKTQKVSDGKERILLLGDSGTGKTRFVGTMPKPFIADFDSGTSTLAGIDAQAKKFSPDGAGWLAFKRELDLWKAGPQYGAETFALDSITQASEAALKYVLQKNGRASAPAQIADWGDAIREIKDVLGILSTLPCHSVVVAHLMVEKDELRGEIKYLPMMYGKDLPGRLPVYFNSVFMTSIQSKVANGQMTTEYKLQVKPDAKYTNIKSRMDRDGTKFQKFEDPDFNHLIKKASA